MAKKRKIIKPKRIDWPARGERWRFFAPAAFLGGIVAVAVLFSDFIFSDKMLFGSDMIQAGIFFRSFLVDYVNTHGSVPQWNPYIFCGMPFVEAFHGDIYYPLSVIKYVGELHRMLGLILVMHVLLSGLFMYLCARQFSLSKAAAVISAACYMFAPYLVSLVAPGHDGKIYVTTLAPVVFMFLDMGFKAAGLVRALLHFTLAGITIGVIILSPHPQMSYFMLWAVAMFTVYRLWGLVREKKGFACVVRPSLMVTYAVILGLLISAIQFYPGYKYTTTFSPRADTKSGWDWATSWSMHEEEAFSLLVPEFSGVSTKKAQTAYWGKNYFKDNSESVGVVALMLALIGLILSRRRDRYFFAGLGLFAFIYALGDTTPLFRIFFYLIPKVSSLRAPSMIMFLMSFSVAMLAGMGMQWIMDSVSSKEEQSKRRINLTLWILPAFLGFIALAFTVNGKGMLNLWTSLFYSEAGATMVQQGVSKLDIAYMNLPSITSGAWFSAIFCLLTALLIWVYRSGKAGTLVLLFLPLLVVVSDIRFDRRFVDTVEPDLYWNSNPISDFLAGQPGYFRVMNLSKAITENFLPQHGIQVVTGYHGNQLRWFDGLLGGPGAPNRMNPNLLNLTGVKYLVVPSNAQIPEGYFGPIPVSDAADFGQVKIIKNDNALPRVFLAGRFQVLDDLKKIHDMVLKAQEDYRTTVLLETDPELVPDTTGLARDSAWITDYQIDSITIGVSATQNRLLVLTDTYFDAWHAFIDGKPAKTLRAYGAFRAVEVPSGTKSVVFKYESRRYAVGYMVTLLASLFALIVVGASWYLTRGEQHRSVAQTVE